jgi:hypothetical protein
VSTDSGLTYFELELSNEAVQYERARLRLIPAHRFVGRPHVALETPFVDHLGVEAPIGADSEAGELASAQKLVNGGRMDTEVSGKLPHRHHARQIVFGFCHVIFSNAFRRRGPQAGRIDIR